MGWGWWWGRRWRRGLQLVGGERFGGLAVEVDADAADTVGRADALAHLGERRRGFDVGGVLVNQAALETAALARHLGRRHGQVLVLRHLDRHRGELRQEGRAAELAATRADAAHHLGLIAHADLPQLDAHVVAGGQIAHQIAEVDTQLGGEIEDRPSAALEFDAEDLDPQFLRGGTLTRERPRLRRALARRAHPIEIARLGPTQNAGQRPLRRRPLVLGPPCGGHSYRSDLRLAAIVDDDLLAVAQLQLAGVAGQHAAAGVELHAGDVDCPSALLAHGLTSCRSGCRSCRLSAMSSRSSASVGLTLTCSASWTSTMAVTARARRSRPSVASVCGSPTRASVASSGAPAATAIASR